MLIDTSVDSVSTLNKIEWVDSHAHLNFNAYENDADEVIRRSLDAGVWMINVGSNYITSERAVEIAQKYPEGIYAAIGLHPIHAQDKFEYQSYKNLAVGKNLDSSGIKNLAKNKKVVAVGEIGLDYKSEYVSFKERQKEVFLEQLRLAKELNLPVIFHCRMAHKDLIKILSEEKIKSNQQLRGVVHCFTGNWSEAQQYLDMGFYLGFNGIIFKLNLDKVIENVPLERVLVETDCPYLTPLPAVALTKAGRNEPLYVRYVAEKIAKIKNLSYEEIAEITAKNAKKLFGI